jgi:hypothetical protein
MLLFKNLLLLTAFAFEQAVASPARLNVNVTRSFTLSPARSPRPEKQKHDADYHSFSIEFCFMADYAGNDT